MADTESSTPADAQEDQPQSFVSHLVELRSRLLKAILAILLCTICLLPFAQDIYTFAAGPLTKHLPENSTMIAIDVASPLLTPFKLTLVCGLFIALPFVLYQMWAFIAPGLYTHEKRLITPLVISSTLLFYLGCAFAYYVVFPLIFAFLTSYAPTGVAVMTDIARYLDFILVLFLAFGLAFEVPIATFLLVWMGVVDRKTLASKRRYVIVIAFTLGMLLTPPDMISQTLLAVPVWLLFEIGLVASGLVSKQSDTTT